MLEISTPGDSNEYNDRYFDTEKKKIIPKFPLFLPSLSRAMIDVCIF